MKKIALTVTACVALNVLGGTLFNKSYASEISNIKKPEAVKIDNSKFSDLDSYSKSVYLNQNLGLKGIATTYTGNDIDPENSELTFKGMLDSKTLVQIYLTKDGDIKNAEIKNAYNPSQKIVIDVDNLSKSSLLQAQKTIDKMDKEISHS